MAVISDIFIDKMEDIISCVREGYKWQKLFVDTGSILAKNPDILEPFQNDLYKLFSKKNMKELSNKLKDKNGYEFFQLLHDELYDLMLLYDISPMDAETYINHFSVIIIDYIKENDPGKTMEMFLEDCKEKINAYFNDIKLNLTLISSEISDLKKSNVSSYSIMDIDYKIRKESKYKGMGLNFFELDDEQFEAEFLNMISNEIIFIIGKSREETTYRILNEIQQKNFDRITLMIRTVEEWERLSDKNIKGHIFIPCFYAESIAAIPNNTNIFIYNEDEPCYSNEKLILRKRTQKNLIDSLTKIGMGNEEAYKLAEDTHGLYAPLKKKLFNIAVYETPEWVKDHSDIILAALLCGKWTDSEGDKLVFEELADDKYDNCKKNLVHYLYLENPFIVINKSHKGNNIQLASVEDAWEELDRYILDELWNKFVNLFYEILIESEPLFDYPFEKHFEANIYAEKPEFSYPLKTGMIRTLIMRAYYRGHEENQVQVDSVISKVLNTITDVKRWGYISQYIPDMCEASPGSVMDKLEEELRNPSGLIDLFAINDGDAMTGRHYYTNILWAIEQLLQQKRYVSRAINWLWEMDSYNIKYNISNSPRSILDIVFCAWINISSISVDNKIGMARMAIEKYPNAWEVIASKLPNMTNSVCSSLNTPKYREIDEPDILTLQDILKTYTEYLLMCVNNINKDVNRWIKILGCLNEYDIEVQKEIFKKLILDCHDLNDDAKIKIKNEIRSIIYRHRLYADANWSMTEENILMYENLMDKIILSDKVYDYIYLLFSPYQFPLLHPVPCCQDENGRDYFKENTILQKKEIETGIKDFKEKGYSLKKLIDYGLQIKNNMLGQILAQFYCNDVFDIEIFHLLVKEDEEGKAVYDYIKYLYQINCVNLREVVNDIKQLTDNDNLVVNLLSLEVIVDKENALIANESNHIKSLYWSMDAAYRLSENIGHDGVLWAIDECKNYGTLSSYIEILYLERNKISNEELYKGLMDSINMTNVISNSITTYYLKELLKILQSMYIEDDEKCQGLAVFEWRCRNILEWDSLKCLSKIMSNNPALYAELVHILYKTDDNEIENEEKSKLANEICEGFLKAQFCPGEKDGKIEYEDIKNWVDRFKELLASQGQERLFGNLLGRLLSYSPIGMDGIYPCESVREIVEEYYSEALKNAYVIAEENKRGVHYLDAGRTELELAERYKKNAEKLQEQYPKTSEIYFELYNSLRVEADYERGIAENEP